MSSLLFINPYFEEELGSSLEASWQHLMQRHPLYRQLHYLSFLVAQEEQVPFVVERPSMQYLQTLHDMGLGTRYHTIEETALSSDSLTSWGASLSLSLLALEKKLSYDMPSWSIVKKVHSKAFSFAVGQKLPHAQWIQEEEQLCIWWHSFSGPKVLKSLYGFSGRGHFISSGKKEDLVLALTFFRKNQSSCIAEPWLPRIVDFSSQWEIQKEGAYRYLGSTIFESSSKGVYQRSLAGPESILFSSYRKELHEHLSFVEKVVEHLVSLGYFGPLGFDAMIYEEGGKKVLHPLVEINARRTMGFVALSLHRKLSLSGSLWVRYGAVKDSDRALLPRSLLLTGGKEVLFAKNLLVELT